MNESRLKKNLIRFLIDAHNISAFRHDLLDEKNPLWEPNYLSGVQFLFFSDEYIINRLDREKSRILLKYISNWGLSHLFAADELAFLIERAKIKDLEALIKIYGKPKKGLLV